MNFVDAIKTCLTVKYCDFNGRARRSEYWWFCLFNALVVYGLMLLCMAIGNEWIATVASLAMLLPGLGVSVRRLHDVGKSGWWLLICLIPLAAFYILYLLIIDSEYGENKYGPNPKGLNGDSSSI